MTLVPFVAFYVSSKHSNKSAWYCWYRLSTYSARIQTAVHIFLRKLFFVDWCRFVRMQEQSISSVWRRVADAKSMYKYRHLAWSVQTHSKSTLNTLEIQFQMIQPIFSLIIKPNRFIERRYKWSRRTTSYTPILTIETISAAFLQFIDYRVSIEKQSHLSMLSFDRLNRCIVDTTDSNSSQ